MRDKVEIWIHSAQAFSALDSLRCEGVEFDAVPFDVTRYSVNGQDSDGTTLSFSLKNFLGYSASIMQFLSRFSDSRIKIETPFAVIEVKQKADLEKAVDQTIRLLQSIPAGQNANYPKLESKNED